MWCDTVRDNPTWRRPRGRPQNSWLRQVRDQKRPCPKQCFPSFFRRPFRWSKNPCQTFFAQLSRFVYNTQKHSYFNVSLEEWSDHFHLTGLLLKDLFCFCKPLLDGYAEAKRRHLCYGSGHWCWGNNSLMLQSDQPLLLNTAYPLTTPKQTFQGQWCTTIPPSTVSSILLPCLLHSPIRRVVFWLHGLFPLVIFHM